VDQLDLAPIFVSALINPDFFSSTLVVDNINQGNDLLYFHLESLVHQLVLKHPHKIFIILKKYFSDIKPKSLKTFPTRMLIKLISEFPTLGIRATIKEELQYQKILSQQPVVRTFSSGRKRSSSVTSQDRFSFKNLPPHLFTQISNYEPDLTFLFESLLDFIAVNYKNRIMILLNFLEPTVARMKEHEKIFFAHRISERLISLKNPNSALIKCCILVMSHVSSSSNLKNLILLEQVIRINNILGYDEYLEYFLAKVDDDILSLSSIAPGNIWFNNYQDDTEEGIINFQNQLENMDEDNLKGSINKK
jgi:hypothetical protein